MIFRLQYHQYLYRDTISRWLLTKAEEHFTCPGDITILCRTATQIFQHYGENIITVIIVIIIIIIINNIVIIVT